MNPFGPLLPFELTRIVRKQWLILARLVYAFVLLILLGLTYLATFPDGPRSWAEFFFRSDPIGRREMAVFAPLFALSWLAVQFNFAAIVTLNFASNAIADERERQALPFLLATPQTDREIILSKYGARVGQTAMLLLAGLPFLSLIQLFGGVDPLVLTSAFVITAVTVLSQAAIGVWASVAAPTVKLAQQRAGQYCAWLVGVPSAVWLGGEAYTSFGQFPHSFGWTSAPLVVRDLEPWVNVANPVYLVREVVLELRGSGVIDAVLPPLVAWYAATHMALAVGLTAAAAWRLRRVAARMADRATPTDAESVTAKAPAAVKPRPPVSDRPVLWRELHCSLGKVKVPKWQRFFQQLFYLISFAPLIWIMIEEGMRGRGIAEPVNIFVRMIGTAVVIGAALHAAGSAANSIGRDRRQGVLGDLLTTNLSTADIQRQKYLAAVVAAKWLFVWVGVHWAVAVAVGGISPVALPVMLAVAAVHLALATSVGTYFAARCRSAKTASGLTVMTVIGVNLAPFVAAIALGLLFQFRNSALEKLLLYSVGASPGVVLGFVTFRWQDLDTARRHLGDATAVLLVGTGFTLIYAVLAVTIWRAAVRHFAATCRVG